MSIIKIHKVTFYSIILPDNLFPRSEKCQVVYRTWFGNGRWQQFVPIIRAGRWNFLSAFLGYFPHNLL